MYVILLFVTNDLNEKEVIRWQIIRKSNGTLKRLSLWKNALTALPSWDSTARVSVPWLSIADIIHL